MGVFSSLFASEKNVESLVDGAKSGIDKLFYTEEEKADAGRLAFEMQLRYMEATAPYKIARRYIALIVCGIWAWCVLVGSCMYIWAIFDAPVMGLITPYVDFIFKLVVPSFLTIIYFYFKSRVAS